MRVINRAKRPVAFNDDAGKHILQQYESVDVTGDQHLPHVLSLPGICPTTSVRTHRFTLPRVEPVDPFADDFEEAPDGDPPEYRDGDQ